MSDSSAVKSTNDEATRERVVGVRTGALILALACALALLWGAATRRDVRELAGAAERAAIAQVIDLNSADAATISLLPRIGPTLATRIVEDRRANGPFRSVEDVARVRGIGPRTVESMRAFVVVRGGAADDARTNSEAP